MHNVDGGMWVVLETMQFIAEHPWISAAGVVAVLAALGALVFRTKGKA